MKLSLSLGWFEKAPRKKQFLKNSSYQGLFDLYTGRLLQKVGLTPSMNEKPAGKLWLCHRNPRSKQETNLSSEQLADSFEQLKSSGRDLTIGIGGPDGFSQQQIDILRPDLILSFGKITMPHELALVVVCEQLYRIQCILGNHPYHQGH